MRTLSLLTVAVLVAGCHSSSSTGSGTSAEEACGALVTAQCMQLQSCDPAELASSFGDLATCESRMMLSCLPALTAPSTSATPAQYEECAAALATSACTTMFMRNPPAACRATPGMRAGGAACGDDAQCASTYCKKPANQVCGVCGTRTAAGGTCNDDGDCDFGLACANGGCVPLADLGARCDSQPCAAPNYCAALSNVCTAPRGVGMPCTRTLGDASECDATQGVYCNVQSVCAMQTYAAVGEPCGPGVVCTTGGNCIPSGNPARGTCVSAAPDGGGCMGNSPCLLPAVCAPTATPPFAGMCLLPAPAACM